MISFRTFNRPRPSEIAAKAFAGCLKTLLLIDNFKCNLLFYKKYITIFTIENVFNGQDS
jgi:hypothetical protein